MARFSITRAIVSVADWIAGVRRLLLHDLQVGHPSIICGLFVDSVNAGRIPAAHSEQRLEVAPRRCLRRRVRRFSLRSGWRCWWGCRLGIGDRRSFRRIGHARTGSIRRWNGTRRNGNASSFRSILPSARRCQPSRHGSTPTSIGALISVNAMTLPMIALSMPVCIRLADRLCMHDRHAECRRLCAPSLHGQ